MESAKHCPFSVDKHQRPKGRPQCTTRSTFLDHIKTILPNEMQPDRELASWIPFTRDHQKWKKLILREITPAGFCFDGQQHNTYTPPPPQTPPCTLPPTQEQHQETSPIPRRTQKDINQADHVIIGV